MGRGEEGWKVREHHEGVHEYSALSTQGRVMDRSFGKQKVSRVRAFQAALNRTVRTQIGPALAITMWNENRLDSILSMQRT
jgi:hypothetical protein